MMIIEGLNKGLNNINFPFKRISSLSSYIFLTTCDLKHQHYSFSLYAHAIGAEMFSIQYINDTLANFINTIWIYNIRKI